ncbi:hypothetical protein WA026_000836 [Henosepilachna vigintioctopunctata]|uniref:Uncharacterized protein n=1 Tax=Henosepilachna vigintioctopunctata TaxID=420089 RepID=A0AAW1V8Q8_9CUCU
MPRKLRNRKLHRTYSYSDDNTTDDDSEKNWSTMPKTKRPLETTRISSRRQASKEALKQMQLLLDDEEDDAFVVPDDDDSDKDVRLELHKRKTVSPIIEPPPKKKYKLSHRKSSDGNDRDVIVLKSISNSNYVPKENTLELECFVEELTDCQIEMRKKIELEEKELQAKLDELMKGKHAEVVYKGEFSSAIEVNELISNSKKSFFKPNQLPQLGSHIDESAPAYQLVMDPRLGIIVGTVQKNPTPSQMPPPLTKGKLQLSSAVKSVATIPQSQSSPTTRNMRSRRGTASTPPTPIQTRANNAMPTRQNNVTPNKSNAPTKGNSVTPARSNIATPSRGSNSVSNRGGTVFPTRSSSMLTRATLQVASPSSPTPPVVQTRGMKTVSASTVQTRNSKISPTGKRVRTAKKVFDI